MSITNVQARVTRENVASVTDTRTSRVDVAPSHGTCRVKHSLNTMVRCIADNLIVDFHSVFTGYLNLKAFSAVATAQQKFI